MVSKSPLSSLLGRLALWSGLLVYRYVWWLNRLALRLAWRFRRELAPAVVSLLLVFAAGGWLLGTASAWLLVPASALAAVLYRRSLLRGALSPSARRLRASQAVEQRALSAFSVALDSSGLSTVRGFEEPQYPAVVARRTYEGGSFQWDLALPVGVTVDAMRAHAEGFAVAFGASSVAFDRDPLDASRVTMTVIGRGDLLYADPLPPTPLLERPLGESFTTPMPIGYTSTGEVVSVPFCDLHGLASGTTGSGKSSLCVLPILGAGAADDCRLWLFDLKETDLQMFAPIAYRYFSGLEECSAGLIELEQHLAAKKARMTERKLRKVVASVDEPLDYVMVDEIQELFAQRNRADRDRKEADTERVRHITATGRAAAVIVLGASQRLAADLIPSAILNNCPQRIGLRCTSVNQAKMAMTDQAYEQGATCDTLPEGFPGLGYYAGKRGAPVQFRAYYLDDAAIEQQVARIVAHKAAALATVPGASGDDEPSNGAHDGADCPPDCPVCFEADQAATIARLNELYERGEGGA